MTEKIPVYDNFEDIPVKPCIKSGFCCTSSPCAYGEWNQDKSACKYLLPPNQVGQRDCGRYDWIKENVPNWEFYPSFGAGCCMPLFNEARNKIIKHLVELKKAGNDIRPFLNDKK